MGLPRLDLLDGRLRDVQLQFALVSFSKKLRVQSPKRLVQFQLFEKLTLPNRQFQIELETESLRQLRVSVVELSADSCPAKT